MTDARFPERWLTDTRFTRLSGDAFKLFTMGLAFSVANRREGLLYDDDLPDIPRVDLQRIPELEKAGLWTREGGGWLIAEYASTQTSIAELEAADRARVVARDRKARQRQRDRAEGDVSLMSRVTSQDRKGQDRPGQADDVGGTKIQDFNEKERGEPDWPVSAIPAQAAPAESAPNFPLVERVAAEQRAKEQQRLAMEERR